MASKKTNGQRTYQTRLQGLDAQALALLDAYATLYGRVERSLFAVIAKGGQPESVKGQYQRRYGITARQFNAVCRTLKGKVASIKERRKGLIEEARQRLKQAEKTVAKLEKQSATDDLPDRPRRKNKLHQKKRRRDTLRQRLAKMEADHQAGLARLCFGSRRLFRAQFDLAANGYTSHAQWREDWEAARSRQFYVLGSKDETAGCQGCVGEYLGEQRFAFRLRLPEALVADNGGEKYLRFEAQLPYGTDHLVAALTLERAVSYRFLRDDKGWRIFVSTEALPFARTSDQRHGMIGADLNADHLAVTETDRFGNPVATRRIPLILYGCSREQAKARIGAAIKELMAFAAGKNKPIAIEKLDFARKKAQLEEQGVRYRRMLSSFAYAQAIAMIKARAHDAGVEVFQRNPAFTSVIGQHKFAERYGLSSHQAAALAIARRALNLSERPNRHMALPNARALPARNRERHVWSFWRQVARKAAAHAAHQGSASGRSRSSPAQSGKARAATLPLGAGESPARESSAALFG